MGNKLQKKELRNNGNYFTLVMDFHQTKEELQIFEN